MFLLEVRQGCHKSVDVDRVILYILKNCNMHIYIYIVIHTHTHIYIYILCVYCTYVMLYINIIHICVLT